MKQEEKFGEAKVDKGGSMSDKVTLYDIVKIVEKWEIEMGEKGYQMRDMFDLDILAQAILNYLSGLGKE